MTARPFPSWRHVETTLVDLVGLPFVRGARGPLAFDCWGLVLEVRARLGLVVPPDYTSGDLSRAEMLALFHVEKPVGWRRCDLTNGAIVLARDAGHAGIHLIGRILHAQVQSGVVAWSLGHWTATVGDIECWEAVDG